MAGDTFVDETLRSWGLEAYIDAFKGMKLIQLINMFVEQNTVLQLEQGYSHSCANLTTIYCLELNILKCCVYRCIIYSIGSIQYFNRFNNNICLHFLLISESI